MPIEGRYLLRGLAAGLLAGLLAFAFARVVAEPVIQRSIDYESARDAAQAALDRAAGRAVEAPGPDLFSRGVQRDVGLLVGVTAMGLVLGAFFSIAYSICVRGVGRRLGPRALALAVAGLGFVSLSLVPSLKYPANPPSVGHPDTIRQRGMLYLITVVVSVATMVAVVWLARQLRGRLGGWHAGLVAGAVYAVVVGVAMAVLPPLGHLADNVAEFGRHATETPLPLRDPQGRIVLAGFSADDLWSFRVDAMVVQVLLWGVVGLVFAELVERLTRKEGRVVGWGAQARWEDPVEAELQTT